MRALLLAILIGFAPLISAADHLNVVSSIRPFAMMVSEIGGDAVESTLLLPPGASPHDYQFRPSDLRRMMDADLFLWLGPELEHNLSKSAGRHAHAVALFPELTAADDPHVWLDLPLVQVMARRIAEVLSRRMPTRGAYFHSNAARFISELRQYDKTLAEQLKHAPHIDYLLVHDGFGRFENHYRLGPGEIVMKSEGQLPGARHVAGLREKLLNGVYACVFTEPQYPEAMLEALLEGVELPVMELDFLGWKLPDDAGFLALYRGLGEAYLRCAVATERESGNWPAPRPAKKTSLSGKQSAGGHIQLDRQAG